MVIPMSRPWKHPKTGIFWLRKRVPAALVPLVGKAMVTRTLQTRDLEEAKRLQAVALLALEDAWKTLREGPSGEIPPTSKSLSEREAHERAAWLHDSWLHQHRDNPSEQTFWPTDLYPRLWSATSTLEHALSLKGEARVEAIGEARRIRKLEEWCLDQADDQAAARNWTLDSDSRLRLAKALGAAVQRASLRLEKEAAGEIMSDEPIDTQRNAPNSIKSAEPPKAGATSITALMEGWQREARAAGRKSSTFESYRNTIEGFKTFLGHDDAARVTPSDVVNFKDYRLTTPSRRTGKPPSAKTVKDSDLTALKAVFGWAAANHKVAGNPAAGITIKVGKKRQVRPKGFTDDEASALLAAALRYEPRMGKTIAAKHWVPWLCAFTGARVGEIAQLRKEDIKQCGGHWLITITPEAGTVKSDQARNVVLHQQLIDLGFLDFVAQAHEGHLFLRPSETGEVRGPLRGLKNRLAEAARAIVADPNVAPNHGWRHRFKTIGRQVGIDAWVLDAIQGHVPRTDGEGYGDVTVGTIAAAIRKIPAIDSNAT